MIRIKATIGNTTVPSPVYYLSSEPLDYNGIYWEPRIINTFEITNYFTYSDTTSNRVRSLQIKLDNRDGYFNDIQESDGFLNSEFILYYDNGNDISKKFTGYVNQINSFGDDIILTIMEKGYSYLKMPFPDAQISENYYTEEGGINASWSAIPICFGTVNDLPAKWCDIFNSRFMVCSGPIFKIRRIKFEDTVIYDSTWSDPYQGYQPTPDSPKIKVRIYRGIGDDSNPEVIDGITSVYKGFCYIEFYDASTGNAIEPRMPDNSVPRVYVDLDGIMKSDESDAERNPAQIIYNLFNKPTTGYEGYGLGIDASDLDFTDAITECENQGLLLDGAITNKDTFGKWLDVLLQSCKGAITEQDGKIKLYIDTEKTVRNVVFDESGETGYNCIVFDWTEPKLEAQINRLRLFYRYNYKTGRYDRIPELNEESPLGDTHLIDENHALRINKYNVDILALNFIRDDETAHKLAQYYFKRNILQLKQVSIVTETTVPDDLTAGDVIKLTSQKHGWVEKEFTIVQISKAEDNFKLILKEYDSNVYVYDAITPGSDNDNIDASKYSIPDKPTNLNITQTTEIISDGTSQTILNVSYTKPESNVSQVALYYKLDTESDFKFLFSSFDNNMKVIWRGKEVGKYNFRVVTISPTGVHSKIDIETGDSHFYSTDGYNTETSMELKADQTIPGAACIYAVNPVIGGVSLALCVDGGLPDDFDHFIIQRSINGGAFETIENKWTTTLFSDIDKDTIGYDVTTCHYNPVNYRIKAVDKTGNESASWSNETGNIIPLSVGNNDITCDQIIAKDFRTACNVGSSVDGVLFNSEGIIGWKAGVKTFCLSNTGDAYFTGTINANTGIIGGWCIENDRIYSGGFPNSEVDIAQVELVSGCPVSDVKRYGLYTYNVTCDESCNKLAISIGHTLHYPDIAWCQKDGIMIADTEYGILFEVSRDRGSCCIYSTIAGWNFNGQCLYNNNITINSSGSIGTNDFSKGNTGWCISCNGDAEFNNITARGAIKTAVFVKDEISVIGGKTLIRPAQTICCHSCCFSDTCEIVLYNDTFEQFSVGDIVRIKDGSNDYWGYVNCCGCSSIYTDMDYICVCYCSGTTGWVPSKGQAIVNYGKGDGSVIGGILLDGQCPYIDIYTHNGCPWNGTNTRVKLGNLNGSFGFNSDTYGIGIGDISGHHLTYDTTSNTLNMTGAISIQSGSNGAQNLLGLETVPALNNFSISGNDCGYFPSGTVLSHGLTTTTKNSQTVCVYCLVSNCNAIVTSTTFKIDPNSAYKFDFSISGDSTTGTAYWGLYVYDCNGNTLSVNVISPSTGECQYSTSNFYWWYGHVTNWRDMTAYLLPEGIDAKDVPYGKNISFHAQMPSNAYCMRIRFLNYGNNGTTSTKLFYSPSVTKVNIENSNSVYRGLSSDGTLISRVKPYCSVSPSGSGLYLGSDYLGYHNGSNWATYMDNNGHFYLCGTSGGLAWNGYNLTVCGTICTNAGYIANWIISNYRICSTSANDRLFLDSYYNSVFSEHCSTSFKVTHGQIHDGSAWTGRYGLAIYSGTTRLFEASNGICQFAGWNFNCQCFYNNNIIIDSNGSISGNYVANCSGWCVNSNGNAEFNCAILRGNIYANNGYICGCIYSCEGNIGGWDITCSQICHTDTNCNYVVLRSEYSSIYAGKYDTSTLKWCNMVSMGQVYDTYNKCWTNRYGIAAGDTDNGLFFELSNGIKQIAGWCFNKHCFYNNNIILDSNGSISGNYVANCSGWCIDCNGCSIFNDAILRGTVCSNGGNIGSFIICNGNLLSSVLNGSNFGVFDLINGAGSPQLEIYYDCTDTSNTISYFGFISQHNGCDSMFAPLQVYTCGLFSACFAKNICVENYIYSTINYSHAFVTYNTSGQSLIFITNQYNGCCNAYAPLQICVCCSNSCYALCTNGIIQANSFICSSDKKLKCDFNDFNVLPYINKLDIYAWKFKGSDICKIGPTSQDFYNTFKGFSNDCKSIPDISGIALKGVKELQQCILTLEKRIKKLENNV